MVVHVVEPLHHKNCAVLLCPESDEDRVEGVRDGVERVCTAIWLDGQQLRHEELFGERTCSCFQTDPYQEDPEATDAQKRYFHYRTIAVALGAVDQRVERPACAREKVEELYGKSQVG
ncbi:MAG: hypothetical protein SGPRY_003730, partial [Prymnesium sp.]